jgi:IS30 family transposase
MTSAMSKLKLWKNFLNHRPQKMLNYKTPLEVFFNRDFATDAALQI